MMLDFAANKDIRQLRAAGLRPGEALVRNIIKHRDLLFTPLLQLALELDLFNADEPDTFAPLHALRILGDIPHTDMIEPLVGRYPVPIAEYRDDLNEIWMQEVPQMVGRLGEAAIAPLWQIIDDPDWQKAARDVSSVALCYAVTAAPDQREAVVEGFRERLQRAEDKDTRTIIAVGLCWLGVADAYRDVMTLFREGKIDIERLPAGGARQLLLSGGDKTLSCVNHPLFERYDVHGPQE